MVLTLDPPYRDIYSYNCFTEYLFFTNFSNGQELSISCVYSVSSVSSVYNVPSVSSVFRVSSVSSVYSVSSWYPVYPVFL